MIFFSSVHFQLGYPMWANQQQMIWTAKFNLDEFVSGVCVAAGAKLLQGVGEKILDDRVTDIKE